MRYDYEKQNWNSYDSNMSIDFNKKNYGVLVPEYLNHMEEGIAQANKNSISSIVVESEDDANIDATIKNGQIKIILPKLKGSKGEKGDPGQDGEKGDPGLAGTNGYSIGVSKEEPNEDSDSINKFLVASVNNIGDHFITPSGKIFRIVGEDDINYFVSDTNIAVRGGKDGDQGEKGDPGRSVYDIAVEKGFEGTEEEWLASLKGQKGDPGQDGIPGEKGDPGQDGIPGEKGEPGKKGDPGENGRSAYEVALAEGYDGTEAEWLKSLNGDPGTNGKSAYQIAVDNGFEGTEAEWLESLKGEPGTNGVHGFSIGTCSTIISSDNINKYYINSVNQVGDHFVGINGDLYRIDGETEELYIISNTGINLKGIQGEQGLSVQGDTGSNIGISLTEPVDGNTIDYSHIKSANREGDHFISPSGKVYCINMMSPDATSYNVEYTGICLMKNVELTVGNCSNLTVISGKEFNNIKNANPDAYRNEAGEIELEVAGDICITWTDPIDEGVPYGGTRVVAKIGKYSEGPDDGDRIVDIFDKNQHTTLDTCLRMHFDPISLNEGSEDEIYMDIYDVYITLFPFSSTGVYNTLMARKQVVTVDTNEVEVIDPTKHEGDSDIPTDGDGALEDAV